jgi:hypothetical protein
MLRLTAGVGGGSMTAKTKLSADPAGIYLDLLSADTTFSGAGGSFALDLGASVVDGLVLHGRLADVGIVNPNVTVDGEDLGSLDKRGVGALLLAPAVTYYFMPINLYLTGAAGLSWVELTRENSDGKTESYASDAGFGLNVDVGKEWWVSDNWGIGAAARLWLSAASSSEKPVSLTSGDPITVTTDYRLIAFTLVFSATYQ